MSLSYLTEAFKSLEILEEEDFNLANKEDVEKLQDFENDLPEDTIEIMSMDFDDVEEAEEENEESHIGDVILDCPVCHSKLYKHSDEVVIDEEEQLANVGEECPYCYTSDGFKIVGQVAPYQPEDEITVDVEDKIEDSDDEVEEKEEVEESLNESKEDIITYFSDYEIDGPEDVKAEREEFRNYNLKAKISSKLTPNYTHKVIVSGKVDDMIRYAEETGDESLKYELQKRNYLEESLNESKEVDLTEYQKWVDYDMKKYHKISKNTMDKIKSAGLSVVKD
ncbi:MAG: hypothetical protein J6Y28_04415 [Acholeplasmatales bacterium]|nr:hypothetical protein [Methanobrevibacter sp.]MBP5445398.1 hypothetical protein [Acholeplasmatales bacterium]